MFFSSSQECQNPEIYFSAIIIARLQKERLETKNVKIQFLCITVRIHTSEMQKNRIIHKSGHTLMKLIGHTMISRTF